MPLSAKSDEQNNLMVHSNIKPTRVKKLSYQFYEQILDWLIKSIKIKNIKVWLLMVLIIFTAHLFAQNQSLKEVSKVIEKEACEQATILLHSLSNEYPQDSSLRQIYHDIGVCFYNEANDKQAIAFFKKEIEVTVPYYPSTTSLLFDAYLNLAESYYLGFEDDENSIQYAQKALSTTPLKAINKGRCHKVLATVFEGKGDFKLAEEHYLKALAILKKQEAIDWLAEVYTGLGTIYSRQGQSEQAILALQKAAALYTTLAADDGLIVSFANLGIAFAEAEIPQLDSAIFYLEKSLRISQQADWIDYTAADYNSLGWVFNLKGDYLQAQSYLQKALDWQVQIKESPYHYTYSEIYDNMGDSYRGLQDFDQALHYYQLAVLNRIPQYQTPSENQLPDLKTMLVEGEKAELLQFFHSIAKTYYLKFWTQKEEKYLEDALNYFQLADELIDLMRYEHTNDQTKFFWRKATRQVYEEAVEAAYSQQNLELGFYFMEKSRAVLLLDELRDKDAKLLAGIPDDLLLKEENFKKEILERGQAYILAFANVTSKDTLKALNVQLDSLKSNYANWVEDLEMTYPSYYKIKYANKIPSLSESTVKWATTGGFIEFFTTENLVYALVIYQNKQHFIKIPDAVPLYANTQKVIELLQEAKHLDEKPEMEQLNNLAHQIYQQLFPEIPTDINHWTIVPDGIFSYLPFQILRPTDKTYWIEQAAISYAYSASTLQMGNKNKHENNSQYQENLLAIAPSHFDDGLEELAHSVEEVSQIQNLIGGDVLINEAASTENFLNNIRHQQIIHFSTHAAVGDSLHPWIAFYGQEKLYLPSLYRLSLQADLAVLSACETNKGDFKTGEGVLSIARGLAYAGVPSVIATLWNTNEQAAREISIELYKNLKKGNNQAEALRQSQLAYFNRHTASLDGLANPHYWAAFVHTGPVTALELDNTRYRYWWLLLGICVMVGTILVFIKQRF